MAGLLDCDGSGASGVYLPELEDPDHCCASASTMWELTSLMVWNTSFEQAYLIIMKNTTNFNQYFYIFSLTIIHGLVKLPGQSSILKRKYLSK